MYSASNGRGRRRKHNSLIARRVQITKMPAPAFDYGDMDFEERAPDRHAAPGGGDSSDNPGFGFPERRGLPFDPQNHCRAPFGTLDHSSSRFHPFFGLFWRFRHRLESHGWSQDRNFEDAPFGRGAGWFDMPCAKFHHIIAGDAPDRPKFEWRNWCHMHDKRNKALIIEDKVKLEFL
ncbi:hypothetical protein EVAR_3370_1 [Eumeta japonica]|uniref:Uncharacterized protein n=1 Tax=Eumeta variegata TaxID=151549 RepID=A0A4C1SUJ5_EUMVA|nr:hypothetical protein EVAR_3370_1 [Eumeta japonica]